jgi:hypothetical protein
VRLLGITRATLLVVGMLLVACGAPANPTESATGTATVSPTFSGTATPTSTPAPTTTAAATANELTAVASVVYPACTPANCVGGAMFTTCDASSSGTDVFASCPLTVRLVAQLTQDVAGIPSAADPLGGGQDPEWTTESVIATPTATGGVAHVTLGFGPGKTVEKHDLVIVVQGSELLVDDLYCTGTEADTTDAYAAGWLNRSVCTT